MHNNPIPGDQRILSCLLLAQSHTKILWRLIWGVWHPQEKAMFAKAALKTLMVWAAILVLAALNGILREAVLIPRLGTTAGLGLSGLLLSALIIAVTYVALPWLGARRLAQRLAIGLGWLALTLVFEVSLGLWQGQSWAALLQAYTFEDGNIWPVVLLVTALAPYIAAKLRGWA